MNLKIDDDEVKEIMAQKNHRLEVCIGKGAFGAVYRALETNLEEYRAVKIMTHDCNVEKLKSIRDEILVMKQFCQLPGFVKLYDYFIEDNYIFLIMEFCREGNLEDYRKQKDGGFKLAEVRIYAYQLVRAIYALHNNSFIHRDIKPANILINRDFDFLLADFGICYKLKESTFVDKNQLGYTPYFTAPEVRKMKIQTSACDIWGIGVIIAYICFDSKGLHSILTDPDEDVIRREIIKNNDYRDSDFLEFFLPLFRPYENRPKITDLLKEPFIRGNKLKSIKDYRIQLGTFELPTETVACIKNNENNKDNSDDDDNSGGGIATDLLRYAYLLNLLHQMIPEISGPSNNRSTTDDKKPEREDQVETQPMADHQIVVTPHVPEDIDRYDDTPSNKFWGVYLMLAWIISYIAPIAFFGLNIMKTNEIHVWTYGIILISLIYRIVIFTWQLGSLITSFKIGCLTTSCTKSISIKIKSCPYIFFIIILPLLLNIGTGYYLYHINLDKIFFESKLMYSLLSCAGSDIIFWILIIWMKIIYSCCK